MAYSFLMRRVNRRNALLFAAAFASGLLVHNVAQAGLPEVLSGLAQHPIDPNVMALRYENGFGGILYSADGGKSFRVRPALTVTKYGLLDDVPLAITGAGQVLAGVTDGLLESDQSGCDARLNATVGEAAVNALAVHPKDASVLFFVSTQATNGEREGIWRRDADGTMASVGPNTSSLTQPGAPGFYVSGMRVVEHVGAADNLRFIQTGIRHAASASTASTAVFRYSDDLGQSWTEHTIPGSGTPRFMAVDPLDPQRAVVAIATGGTPNAEDPILVTLDSGRTFTSYVAGMTRAADAVVAPDGRVWLTGYTDSSSIHAGAGLWFAPRIGEKPEKLLDGGVQCLGLSAASNKLWLCRQYELGLFDLETRNYCRVFAVTDATSLVSCILEDREQSEAAKEQLCGGWCQPRHHASSPMCSMYNERSACGLSALADDVESGYEPLPQPEARCPGFERADDASVASLEKPDGGAPAEVSPSRDGSASLEPTDASASPSPTKRGDGCALSATRRIRLFELLCTVSVLCALRRRRLGLGESSSRAGV